MKIVYWSPWFSKDENHHWNILFDEPKKLLTKVAKDVSELKNERLDAMIKCPAFNTVAKNTFYIENPIASEFNIVDGNVTPVGDNHYVTVMNSKDTLVYGLSYMFFCEDDLEMLVTGPYFSQTNYTKYGMLVAGKFNIGKWFRAVNMEMLLLDKKDYFKIEEGEPMAYFNFLTDEKVVLKRFEGNDTLRKLSFTCSRVSEWWSNVPLAKRYDKFLKSKTNRLVLREIKKQLVE